MTQGILRPRLATSLAGLLMSVSAIWTTAAGAQNLPLTFGVSQSFQSLTNPDFQSPASGTTGLSITSLSFGSFTSTPTDTFSFDAGIGLLIQREPEGNIDVSSNAPYVGLSYDRTTPSSALSVYASYEVIPLDQIRSIEDFITDDGQIDLPSNPADLTSTGLEQDIQAGGSLELGRDALFGLTLTAAGEQISYTETTDPALQDINRAEAGITGRFNYSPQGSVSLGVSAEHQVTLVPGTTGAATTDVVRDQQNLTLGTSYDVSPVLTLGGFVTYEVVDESGQAQTRTPRAQISADYTYDTGSLSVRLGDQDSALTWQQDRWPRARSRPRCRMGWMTAAMARWIRSASTTAGRSTMSRG